MGIFETYKQKILNSYPSKILIKLAQTTWNNGEPPPDEDLYGSELYKALKKLHELWYKINILENRMSSRSEEIMNRYRGEFYTLSQDVLASIIYQYNDWISLHTKEGRMKMFVEYWEDGIFPWLKLEVNGDVIDRSDCIRKKIEKEWDDATDWFQEFTDREDYSNAKEFLETTNKLDEKAKEDIFDDEEAYQYIQEHDLMEEFFNWSVDNHYFAKHWDFEEMYGDDWQENVAGGYGKESDLGKYVDDECLEEFWKEWLMYWPGWEETTQGVIDATERLEAAVGSYNINEVMTAISLALNTAHNTGSMPDHLGIDFTQLNALSNLNTEQWDEDTKHMAKKVNADDQDYGLYTEPAALSLSEDVNHIVWIYKDGKLYSIQSNPEIKYDHSYLAHKYGIDFDHDRDPAGRISSDGNTLGVWWNSFDAGVAPYTDAIIALYDKDLIRLNTKVKFKDGRIVTVQALLKQILNAGEESGFSAYSQYKLTTDNFFKALVKLHELWYKINKLESKFSARAEKLLQNYQVDFLDLSSKVVHDLIAEFELWYENHVDEDSPTDFTATSEGVNNIIDKLYKIKGSNDVNKIMTTISLALNTAHYNGLMGDYMGLDPDQLDQLSNLDTSKWDKEMDRIASEKK